MTLPNLIGKIVAGLVTLGSLHAVMGANVTVDDADSAIYYTPNHWNANAGGACTGCAAQPDVSQIYGATWHDSQAHQTDPTIILQYTFTGTDLYVYGVLWDNPAYVSNVDLVLTIDGTNYTYQHSPTGTGDSYEYNIPVFALHNLQNQAHTARVLLNTNSNLLFDYLVYTTVDPTSSAAPTSAADSTSSPSSASSVTPASSGTGLASFSSSSSVSPHFAGSISTSQESSSPSPGTIAGIVIGVLALIAILASVIGFICYKRGRRQQLGPVHLPVTSVALSTPLVQSTSLVQSAPWAVPLSPSYPPSIQTESVATWSDAYHSSVPVQDASSVATPPAYSEVYEHRSTVHGNVEGHH